MFPRIVVLVLATALAVGFFARPSGGAGPETRYVVRATDTLWSIAAAHYPGRAGPFSGCVFSFFTEHQSVPCPGCGVSVERTQKRLQMCDTDRRLEYELFQLRYETAAFDAQRPPTSTRPQAGSRFGWPSGAACATARSAAA
jgi:hypothetical protein